VFTSENDDSVGEALPWSSGTPSGGVGQCLDAYDDTSDTLSIEHCRFSYSGETVFIGQDATFSDVQFIQCNVCIEPGDNNVSMNNALVSNCGLLTDGIMELECVNCTFDNCAVAADWDAYFYNCIFSDTGAAAADEGYGSDFTLDGSNNGFYNCPEFGENTFTNTAYPYQAAGAGTYYLADNTFRNAGTAALGELSTKTTYPPIVYSNTTISVATTFSPQAARDTNCTDLGYHYDPLDYVFGGVEAQSNITFTAGTAVGWFDAWSGAAYGIIEDAGVTVSFNGSVVAPCWLARYDTVQESGNGNWTDTGWLSPITCNNPNPYYSPASPQLLMKFTKFSSRNFNDQIRDYSGNFVVSANDCEFYGGIGGYNIQLNFTNCLFFRYAPAVTYSSYASPSLSMQNCTIEQGGMNAFTIQHWGGATWPVSIRDCTFDGTSISMDDYSGGNTNITYCDFNAFLTNADRLAMLGAHDVTNVISFNWQSSWFGNFYLPSDSPLIDAGGITADKVGLYHFTTQVSQVPEGDSIVDIGYHYVATDAYGNPLDTNGDGIPDYLEDANGDGIFDAGDLGEWQISPFGLGGANGLQVFTPLK
jgi:hypothetical protein